MNSAIVPRGGAVGGRRGRRAAWLVVAALGGPTVLAQRQPAERAPIQPTRTTLEAVAIDVGGSVKRAAVGVSPVDKAGWTAVKVNDRLGPGTQIKTGFRSFVTLRFGPDTVVQVRKMTVASLDDYYRTATTRSVRLGLGYGAVRGGSTEGELRSDVVVNSTVATLAKRGTEGWQLWADPSTGRFRASLSRSGLADVLSRLTGDRRSLRPHEYATADTIMKMWVNQDVFDRAVKFYSTYGVTDADSDSSVKNPDGASVTSPSASTETAETVVRNAVDFVTQIIEQRVSQVLPPILNFGPVQRPEGDFGIPPTLGGLFGPAATNTAPRRVAAPRPISTLAHKARRPRVPRSR